VALLAAGYLPLMLTPGIVLMSVLAGVAGVFLAPALACAFIVVDRHAPRGTVTEAFSWLVTTFGVGSAVGTGVAGPAVELGGTAASFGVAAVGGVLALLVLVATRRVLTVPQVRGGGATAINMVGASENDRIGEVEPGFSSGHQA
jgi:predicted MFS family arabinose efflux permease